mmetsp:Transcript_13765/g.26882  ORF Transcript_13765/g.26882 Transcript_13765/m.26882 type:complete len:111 (-) Transcript_13765:225-557(-)|eukprot:464779-Pleurochrysis_carterae.AAC.2
MPLRAGEVMLHRGCAVLRRALDGGAVSLDAAARPAAATATAQRGVRRGGWIRLTPVRSQAGGSVVCSVCGLAQKDSPGLRVRMRDCLLPFCLPYALAGASFKGYDAHQPH